MTTMRRPLGQSYVLRSVSSVAAEGLPVLIADANPYRAGEVADWAFSRPGGVHYVRIPDGAAERVQVALAERDAKRRAAAGACACVVALRCALRSSAKLRVCAAASQGSARCAPFRTRSA